MDQGFTRTQKTFGLILMGCALMIIPLCAGIVFLTQVNSSGKQIHAQEPKAYNKCDFNLDGRVDQADLSLAREGFGQVGIVTNNAQFDVDNNGWVNSVDLDTISTADPKVCK